ncbi:Polyhomeotic-like protein 1 [Varanus komodoensis]|nr:Polyhomeotic-like protein 1 [Varanus komodoensis]
METESEQNSNSGSSSSGSGGSARPQISQMTLYERQAVQALQALQRQPNAAQYFHQFMLQQQLNSAQLHSLAAVQQPQLGNLLQVNRTLGRNVPLTSQLILMPNGAVAAVQQEAPPTHSPGVHTDMDQVQNLAVRSQQSSAANPQLQASSPKAVLPGNSQASVLPQATHSGQTLTVTQASSGNVGQSLNLSQGPAGNNSISGGVASSVGNHTTSGLSQANSSGPGGSCQRKGTGVVQPLPVASAAQAVTVSQGSQTEAENATAKKAETDGNGQQTVGMNLTRTATPAPSQTLISSATYTQIQPHSLIQQQQQIHLQKQVVIQQQIAIHHQQQFQHRQSQLLHTATHLQLAQQQQQQQAPPLTQQQGPPPTPQQAQPLQGQQQAQTLVVQPMLQSQPQPVQIQQDSLCQATTKSSVSIQAKPPIAPLKLSQLGAAKISASQQPPPHIPVQVVGSRQQGSAQAQALGLPHMNTAVQTPRGIPAVVQPVSQSHLASSLSQTSSVSFAASPPPLQETTAPLSSGSKPHTLAIKRKAESEEEREESSVAPSLIAAKSASVAESPKALEEKSGLTNKSESFPSTTPNAPPSDLSSVTATTVPVPTLAMLSRQTGDSKPPQAIVKPQILTHIIEGFVIQEGAEPFPVGCSQLLKEFEKPLQGGAPSRQHENQPSNSPGGEIITTEHDKKGNLLKCEFCGKYGPANQFRGSKRFCSVTCAKRYNVGCSHQLRLQRKKIKEFQEANYARRRRGPRRSSSEIARAKIQGKRHRGQEDSSRGSDNSRN